MSNYKAGNPLDPNTTHGPQADEIQFKRVSEYLKLAKEGEGKGKIELGGSSMKMEGGNGFFIEPTIITGQEESARLMKEEIFGPVVAINVFKTEKEAIAKAVDSEFGSFFPISFGGFALMMTRLVLCSLLQEYQPGSQSRKGVSTFEVNPGRDW
jgi:acyl-CoA reductase-like NAD-dependent aldehyde dehydrogenase